MLRLVSAFGRSEIFNSRAPEGGGREGKRIGKDEEERCRQINTRGRINNTKDARAEKTAENRSATREATRGMTRGEGEERSEGQRARCVTRASVDSEFAPARELIRKTRSRLAAQSACYTCIPRYNSAIP